MANVHSPFLLKLKLFTYNFHFSVIFFAVFFYPISLLISRLCGLCNVVSIWKQEMFPDLSHCFVLWICFESYFQSKDICSWEASPWTACSVSCDEGIQIRNISCLKEVSGSLFLESPLEECSHLTAPNTSQSCNLRDCFSWTASSWSQVIMAIVIISPT